MSRFLAVAGVWAVVMSYQAAGELQNVIVNGSCSIPSEERMAEAAFIPCGDETEDLPVIRLAAPKETDWNKHGASARLDSVTIPAMPQPEKYAMFARVFLCFYLGVPKWTEDNAGRIDLIVSVDGYRAFQCEQTKPGWHPWFVDMGPWAGKDVSITFTVGWLDGEPREVIVALPRTVACHGPYYTGVGGISTGPGPHGMPGASGGVSGGNMDEAAKGENALALLRLDAITPGTVRLTSGAKGRGFDLMIKGVYWLPLPLDPENPDVRWEHGSGSIERGPVDIVPNFLAGDEERLRTISAKER